MSLFRDASVGVPLLLPEEKSQIARSIWEQAAKVWAWNWMLVEVDSALMRRCSDASAWRSWRELETRFDWVLLDQTDVSILRSMNRSLGLRAADAGHVFLFERLSAHIPNLHMVTFDQEMVDKVESLGLSVHAACLRA